MFNKNYDSLYATKISLKNFVMKKVYMIINKLFLTYKLNIYTYIHFTPIRLLYMLHFFRKYQKSTSIMFHSLKKSYQKVLKTKKMYVFSFE